MTYAKINSEGEFEAWDQQALDDLQVNSFSEDLGNKLIWHNNLINIWGIELLPNERLGFRKISYDFSFTSIGESYVLNHWKDGEIFLAQMKIGDLCHVQGSKLKGHVWSLENISIETLRMLVLEFRDNKKNGNGSDLASLMEPILEALDKQDPKNNDFHRAFLRKSVGLDFTKGKTQNTKRKLFCCNIYDL